MGKIPHLGVQVGDDGVSAPVEKKESRGAFR